MIKKIDLHLHLDGSIKPKTIEELYVIKNKVELPKETKLFIEDGMPSLTEYLEYFNLPLALLKDYFGGITRISYEMVKQLNADHVDYAEIRYAPQLLTTDTSVNGILKVMEAVEVGFQKGMELFPKTKVNTIICLMRGMDYKVNQNTYEAMLKFPKSTIVALDMAGDEYHFLGEEYKDIFLEAKSKGYHITIHAGENRGPESICMAVEFGAERIGHGLSLNLSEKMMGVLAERKICLESCPISNFQTGAVLRYGYDIELFLKRGIPVTINTDNMTVSNTNLQKEYTYLKEHYGFNDESLELMKKFSEEYAFYKKN